MDTWTQITNIKQLVETTSDLSSDERDDYISAMSCFEVVIRHMEAGGLHAEVGTALISPYLVPKRIIMDISNRRTLALVIFSPFECAFSCL